VSFCENRRKKGYTLLLDINEVTFMHVLTPFSAHHPTTPPPFLRWPGVVTFCTHYYSCNSIYQYGQVTTTLHSKNIKLLSLFFLRNHHSRHTVDRDQEFWMSDVIKRYFKEWCIQCNCPFLIWAIFQNHKKWMIIAGKWHIRAWIAEVSLYWPQTFEILSLTRQMYKWHAANIKIIWPFKDTRI
jgi:hypothetical protein